MRDAARNPYTEAHKAVTVDRVYDTPSRKEFKQGALPYLSGVATGVLLSRTIAGRRR